MSRRLELLVLLIVTSLAGCTTTYAGRWAAWNRSAIDDYRRFPAIEVATDTPAHRFAVAAPLDVAIEVDFRGRQRSFGLAELMHATATTALIVVQGDSLRFEGYAAGYHRESVNTSFSIAKSVTSLLIGMAIERGRIDGVHAPITRYLPELAARDARFARLTLAHLLDMRSGLRWRDHDFVTGDKPRAYYHPHLRRLVTERLPLVAEPGAAWQYNSYNPILLGLVLERATGHGPAELLQEWIWKPLGMEYRASWSVDGRREPMVKMESGINARAIDFAKLGSLMLAEGLWNGERVVSAEWVAESTLGEPGCALSVYRPREVCYRRGWWVYPATDATPRAFAATGHLGQYVYVVPAFRLVIVRFGRKPGGVSWPAVFREIVTTVAAEAAAGER